MSKRKVILITSVAAVALAVLGLILGFYLAPVGLSNRRNITINAFFGGEALTLDVKMVKGVYAPDHNLFNSDYTTAELCKMRAEASDGEYSYSYRIYGGNAIIYKQRSGETVAFAELCDVSALDNGQRYLFCNGAFRVGEKSVIAPYHLARDMTAWGQVTDKIYLADGIGLDDVNEFYRTCGRYQIVAADDSLTLTLIDGAIITISYNADEGFIQYSLQ